jgi:toxin ParE1/3/4
MKRLFLTDQAKADMRALTLYTEKTWGALQKRKYRQALHDRLAQIRRNPTLGTSRDDLKPGLRGLISGRHVIYYGETADLIVVFRVLHARMDARSRLLGQPPSKP